LEKEPVGLKEPKGQKRQRDLKERKGGTDKGQKLGCKKGRRGKREKKWKASP